MMTDERWANLRLYHDGFGIIREWDADKQMEVSAELDRLRAEVADLKEEEYIRQSDNEKALQARVKELEAQQCALFGEPDVLREQVAALKARLAEAERLLSEMQGSQKTEGVNALRLMADMFDHALPNDPKPDIQRVFREWADRIDAFLHPQPPTAEGDSHGE